MRPFRNHALAAVCLVAACFTGPKPRNDQSIRSPRGAHGEIDAGREHYAGELLAITASDFTLLTESHVVVIPFAVAGDGEFRDIGINTHGAPWEKHAQQLRYASRYPYGIPPVALEAILRQRGQTVPDTVRLTAR